ncbi:aldose epimerase family protein [Aureliella helgolandensis]|nr:aldose epimerase family protein [Aureliella helgolandensis]
MLTAIALALGTCSLTLAAKPTATSFGKTESGKDVELYTLTNDAGAIVKVMTHGATLVQLQVPDREGQVEDIIFGFDDVTGYESAANQYFGCTAGRVANRIAKGMFTLDGKDYTLAVNNEPNALHGGVERSLDKVEWAAQPFENERGQGVAFSYSSPDGEEGYPGKLDLVVTYALAKDKNALTIRYTAETDAATPINLTNHAYFNLAGQGSPTILDHRIRINADSYTPVDETLIPTGEIKSVEGSPFDLRKPIKIGKHIGELVETPALGYDHNFVLNAPEGDKKQRLAAVLTDKQSGRSLRIMTTEPGIQFYSGNFLRGDVGKGGAVYAHQSACCLETQHFPDSIHHPNFPNTVLKPGEKFRSATVLIFSTVKE